MSTTTTMTMTGNETPDFKKGVHYTEFANPIKEMPPVVTFFSFLDPTSKKWALEYNIVNTIRRHVPSGTTISRYHSSDPYAKELGKDLTQAWALADHLQIDDRVLKPIYDAVHDTKISDMQGVKAAFDQVGIDPLKFDRENGKETVRLEAEWMDECRERLDIKTIPAIVVAGRYLVNPDAFGKEFNGDNVAEVVKELLELRK